MLLCICCNHDVRFAVKSHGFFQFFNVGTEAKLKKLVKTVRDFTEDLSKKRLAVCDCVVLIAYHRLTLHFWYGHVDEGR